MCTACGSPFYCRRVALSICVRLQNNSRRHSILVVQCRTYIIFKSTQIRIACKKIHINKKPFSFYRIHSPTDLEKEKVSLLPIRKRHYFNQHHPTASSSLYHNKLSPCPLRKCCRLCTLRESRVSVPAIVCTGLLTHSIIVVMRQGHLRNAQPKRQANSKNCCSCG